MKSNENCTKCRKLKKTKEYYSKSYRQLDIINACRSITYFEKA